MMEQQPEKSQEFLLRRKGHSGLVRLARSTSESATLLQRRSTRPWPHKHGAHRHLHPDRDGERDRRWKRKVPEFAARVANPREPRESTNCTRGPPAGCGGRFSAKLTGKKMAPS